MLKKLVLGVAATLACAASAEDIDWSDRAVRRQAVLETAYAYGRTFGWDIPLAPGEERVVSWRVRVTAPAGSRIVATGGTAAGIPSNTIETDVVPNRLSAAAARAWAVANVHDVTALPDCRVRDWAGGRRP